MSCDKNIAKPLNPAEIQKQLVAKIQPEPNEYDYLNISEKYRHEEYNIYHRKKCQFLETAKEYLLENKNTLNNSKPRVNDTVQDLMIKSFEIEEDKVINKDYPDGVLIRKRTIRKIHETQKRENEQCRSEPWFRRYLVLNKFINICRKIIIRNRFEKVLAVLRQLTKEKMEEFEKSDKKYENIVYQELFQTFVP